MSAILRAARSEAGFTLLELLVSVTLLGFLSVLLFGSLQFGTTVWQRSESSATDIARIRSVQLQLTTEIERIYPAFVNPPAGTPHVAFTGVEHSLSYLAPDTSREGALAEVSISMTGNGEHSALTRAARPELNAADAASDSKAIVLLKNVQAVEFSYYGAGPDKNGEPQWWPSWNNRTSLPSLIRLKVEFTAPTASSWPDLVVAPRIAVDAGCVFDLLTKYCQGRI